MYQIYQINNRLKRILILLLVLATSGVFPISFAAFPRYISPPQNLTPNFQPTCSARDQMKHPEARM
jgi:hypothetical protein